MVTNPAFIIYQQKRKHVADHCDHAHRHQGAEVHEEEALWKYFQIWQGSAKKNSYTGRRSPGLREWEKSLGVNVLQKVPGT